jgi:hypothetical protein
MKKLFFTIILFAVFAFGLNAQTLFVENFGYTVGDSLQNNGWTLHSGTTGPILVVSPSLTYTGYPLSGIGNAAYMDSVDYEDVNRTFTEQTSGSIYVAFMVNVKTARSAGDYFLHIGPTTLSTIFRLRIFVKDTMGTNILFGASKGSNAGTASVYFSNTLFNYNTTYIIVAKYTFNAGTTTDDEVKLYAFTSPALPTTEPATPLLGPLTDATTDLLNAGTIALRQGTAGQRPSLFIDGIKITKSWSSIIASVHNITTVADNFNLSQNYPNPFNPSTKIQFALPKSGYTTLKVYNTLGEEVSSLVDSKLNNGTYEVEFSGANLVSGTYFYKLNFNGTDGSYFSDTKKLTLIK